jgi:hypothetical protein
MASLNNKSLYGNYNCMSNTNNELDFKLIYYPSKLIVLVNELFNKQRDQNKVRFKQ